MNKKERAKIEKATGDYAETPLECFAILPLNIAKEELEFKCLICGDIVLHVEHHNHSVKDITEFMKKSQSCKRQNPSQTESP